MADHMFLFTPGRWVGGGKITFSASNELIRFYTSWVIEENIEGTIQCNQRVEMQDVHEVVCNHFVVYDITKESFKIDLENELFGKVSGKGIIDSTTIAWEFRHSADEGVFEGFEVYELQDNGDYMLHAEYTSEELFRTIIDARIWKKEAK